MTVVHSGATEMVVPVHNKQNKIQLTYRLKMITYIQEKVRGCMKRITDTSHIRMCELLPIL